MTEESTPKPATFRPLLDLLPGVPPGDVCGPDGYCAPAETNGQNPAPDPLRRD